jgi:SPX domain protein involved in polyphosphate accumulation
LVSRQISLSTPPPTNAHGVPALNSGTEEQFLKLVDAELTKVEKFTLQQVKELRQKLNIAEQLDDDQKEAILLAADEIASRFLRLELYVNINFMGFHKVCCICCRRGWGMLSRSSPS